MSIAIGTRLGSHQITALLGRGGMGEVYRARDTKLKREVAIKILPDEFSRDADRIRRFQREAEVLASLNHPNIAAIYDLEEVGGLRYLVLELVEGETLADRLKGGPIPVGEALSIARHICEALEAAHERAIIHRDLKPANIKITPDGTVKVLDFGLAKAMEGSTASATLSNSPTLTLAGTDAGVIIGTAAYMSPEQARGRPADQRSDVFAFGCVVYEMLTGRQAFQGEDVSDLLASVMKSEVDLNLLPARLSPRLRDLLRRCLAKNRKDRWYAIGDVRFEIGSIESDPLGLDATHDSKAKGLVWRRTALFAAVVIAVAAVTSLAVWNLKPRLPAAETMRFDLAIPEGTLFTRPGRPLLAVSPDGRQLVFVANNQLYSRSLSEREARPIRGTNEDVTSPFFSPDGRWIGFYSLANLSLKKIAISGGAPITICPAGNPFGVRWESGDEILFGEFGKGILRVSANGGKPEVIVAVKSGETAFGPQLLPGGTVLLFTLATGNGADRWDTAQIVAQRLATEERKVLGTGSDARYVPSGHLVYAIGNSVFALPFDAAKLTVTGNPVVLLSGVRRAWGNNIGDANRATVTGAAQFAFSNTGLMTYFMENAAASVVTLAFVDLQGVVRPLGLASRNYGHPRLSPDGKQLAFQTSDGDEQIIWVYDLTGSTAPRRLTLDGKSLSPIWTPDGKRITFVSYRDGIGNIFWQPADGSGSAERLLGLFSSPPETQASFFNGDFAPASPSAWSPVEQLLAFHAQSGGTHLFGLSLEGDKKPRPLLSEEQRKAQSGNLSFSPDGHWIAYAYEVRPTRYEIFVEPFPATGARYPISTNTGYDPVWSPDGHRLYYLEYPVGKLVSVEVKTSPAFSVSSPAPLNFPQIIRNSGERDFDISPDGRRFVAILPGSEIRSSGRPAEQVSVVVNWFEELKQRVPVR